MGEEGGKPFQYQTKVEISYLRKLPQVLCRSSSWQYLLFSRDRTLLKVNLSQSQIEIHDYSNPIIQTGPNSTPCLCATTPRKSASIFKILAKSFMIAHVKYREFGIGETNNPLINSFLYSHHLSA